MANTSLAGARTSALRGAFQGIVRNTALGPVERQVLATTTIEGQPLSDVERDIATSVIRPMLSEKYPGAPSGELHAAAMETADKLTKRDLQTLIQAVRLKANLAQVDALKGRSKSGVERLGFDRLKQLEQSLSGSVDQKLKQLNPSNMLAQASLTEEQRQALQDEIDALNDQLDDVRTGLRQFSGIGAGRAGKTPGAPGQPAAKLTADDLMNTP